MKRLLSLFVFCAFLVAAMPVFAQHNLQSATRPANAPALQQERNSSWITWADETSLTSGIINDDPSDPFDLACMQRFSTSDLAPYNGLSLTKVAFYLWDSYEYPIYGTYEVRVYQGGMYSSGTSMSPGTLVASQTVPSYSVMLDDWTEVTLNTPVTINSSQELWFGVYIHNGAGLLMSYDEYNVTTGKGTLYYDSEDMAWYDINSIGLSFTVGNWGIKGYVYDPNGNDPIIDLGLEYIDDGDNQNFITSMNVPYGNDFMPVPVVWNFEYGAAVNDFNDTLHFEMTIDGTPMGSTGASTTYIATGGGVYWDDFIALTASDIATYNLYGTHTFCMQVMPGPGWYENDPSDNTGCLTVTFEGPTTSNHVITVLNTDGTITPSGNVTVIDGNSQTFTITPSACATINDVLADGVSVLSQVVNNTYTFYNVTSDHTFQVTYNTQSFTLTGSTGGNGNISPTNTTAQCGSNRSFSFTPNPGYIVDYVTDNTVDVTASVVNNTYTINNIQQNHDVFVAFTQDASQTYTLTGSTDGHGTISPTNTTVVGGASQTFTITPNAGYAIDYVTDNTMDVTANVSNNLYTLTNIANNHDIYVAFHVSTEEPCDVPTNVTMDDNGNVCWNSDASNWNVGYSINGGAEQIVTVNNSCFQVPGLNNNDIVTFRVQAVCSSTNTSAWTNSQDFTYTGSGTQEDPCEVPTNISMDETGNICWVSTATSWNVAYSVNGSAEQVVTVASSCFQVPGLNNGDVVTFRVQAICSANNNSDWSASQTGTYNNGGGDNPDAINEYSKSQIIIFPNPANDVLNVRCGQVMEMVEIFNVTGQKVISTTAQGEQTAINVSTLEAGIYFVKVATNGQTMVQKFVKR